MANRLAKETSPYLLQHADNPVDWYPWGDEAFRKARELRRPILLSIGYSACHWCHVMARESFSDPDTADLMNRSFVCVKVDREERPDVDSVYMAALQALTGTGGWPLTAALTPEGKPFFAGTYYPPAERHGLPAFRRVLQAITRAWEGQQGDLEATAAELTAHLTRTFTPDPGELDKALPERAIARLEQVADPVHGGFGGAPKFPPFGTLRFLLARPEQSARKLAIDSLRGMCTGGIFDQLGGGFARYSTDAAWLVPHFEKMLNDNAQLLGLCAAAWRLTGEGGFARAARLSAGWLQRELAAPGGGFHAAMSAESGGVEGLYYLWDAASFREALDGSGLSRMAELAFRVTEAGNHEGRNVLSLSGEAWDDAEDEELEQARRLLLEHRQEREAPHVDNKVLAGWNGQAIEGLADAGRLLADRGMLRAARDTLDRVTPLALEARRQAGSDAAAQLEDLAGLGNGLLALYTATLDPGLLQLASTLAERVATEFVTDGALYSTSSLSSPLVARPRQSVDAGGPADTAQAARLLLRLGRLTDNQGWERIAADTIRAATGTMEAQPTLGGASLALLDEYLAEPLEIVLGGPPDSDLVRAVQDRWLPHAMIIHAGAGVSQSDYPVLEGRHTEDATATAWVCRARVCSLPVTDAKALSAQLPD